MEGSIGDIAQVSARAGLTRADYARVGIQVPDGAETFLRSDWMGSMPPERTEGEQIPAAGESEGKRRHGAGKTAVVMVSLKIHIFGCRREQLAGLMRFRAVNPELPAHEARLAKDLATELTAQAVAEAEADAADPATRTLAATTAADNPAIKSESSIKVSSEFDSVNLLGMAWHYEMNQTLRAADRNWESPFEFGADAESYRETFMRAMADKVEKQWEKDKVVEDRMFSFGGRSVDIVPFRCIDQKAYDAWHRHIPYLRADEAMLSTLANKGDELVPQILASSLYYFIRLQARVLPLFDTFEMPSNPYDFPKITSGPEFVKGVELEDSTNYSIANSKVKYSTVGTDKVTFLAGKASANTVYSRELVEDSGVNFSQAAANVYVEEMADTIDWLLINGDESADATNISWFGTNPSGVTNYDRALVLDGLRHICLAADQVAVASLADDSILTIMKLMGNRGIVGRDIRNLAVVVGPETAFALDALSAYESLEKVGNLATLLNGQLGFWRSVPVIVVEAMELMDSNGRINDDTSNNTKGAFMVVHRSVKVGLRRRPDIEQARVPGVDGHFISASVRLDVQAMEDGLVGIGRNVTV